MKSSDRLTICQCTAGMIDLGGPSAIIISSSQTAIYHRVLWGRNKQSEGRQEADLSLKLGVEVEQVGR